MSDTLTTIFDCWLALVDLLDRQDFGSATNNVTGRCPVHLGFPDDEVDLGPEHVVIIGGVESPSLERASFGQGRMKESVDLLVQVTCNVTDMSRVEVIARLRQMCDAVKAAVHQAIPGSPNRQPRPDVAGVDHWQITRAKPLIVGTRNGHIGSVEIAITVTSHI